jgi:hypothetical protein
MNGQGRVAHRLLLRADLLLSICIRLLLFLRASVVVAAEIAATAFSGLLKYPGLAKNIQTPKLVRHLGFSHRQTSPPNCSRQLPGAAPGLLHQE